MFHDSDTVQSDHCERARAHAGSHAVLDPSNCAAPGACAAAPGAAAPGATAPDAAATSAAAPGAATSSPPASSAATPAAAAVSLAAPGANANAANSIEVTADVTFDARIDAVATTADDMADATVNVNAAVTSTEAVVIDSPAHDSMHVSTTIIASPTIPPELLARIEASKMRSALRRQRNREKQQHAHLRAYELINSDGNTIKQDNSSAIGDRGGDKVTADTWRNYGTSFATVPRRVKRPSSSPAWRAARFAKWLVDMYGLEQLSCGSGVLDIAGGRGDLAFQLCCRYGVPCTVIDPVPMRPSAKQQRLMEHRRRMWDDLHSNDAARAAQWSHRFSTCEEQLGRPERPHQLLRLFVPAFTTETTKPADYTEESAGPAVGMSPAQLWQHCSVVVGFHPDEATSPIVECSLRARKPFAVVPCCVYPSMFPHRRTPSNEPVRTYTQLCEHIVGLSPDVRTALLDIPGRNLVCFMTSAERR